MTTLGESVVRGVALIQLMTVAGLILGGCVRTAVEYPLGGSTAAIRAAFSKCDMPKPPLPEQGRTTLSGVY
jgi:hypothetical protein